MKRKDGMRIQKLTACRWSDLHTSCGPFPVVGKIRPTLRDGVWSYTEELSQSICWKTYPICTVDASYLDSPDKAIFLAYSDADACVGQVILRKDWNRYAFIEDIAVKPACRGQGFGTALVQQAAVWARAASLDGLALETQDNNVLACRFYAKLGFVIGAVNTMLYKNFPKPWCDEAAVFWYLSFPAAAPVLRELG